MAMERDERGRGVVRLDGSMGPGNLCRLTITTADKVQGELDTTYEFPYTLIDFPLLQKYLDINYILGYSLKKMIPADDQPIMFRVGSPQEGE